MADNDYSSIWTLNSAAVKEAVDMMKYLVIVMVATAILFTLWVSLPTYNPLLISIRE